MLIDPTCVPIVMPPRPVTLARIAEFQLAREMPIGVGGPMTFAATSKAAGC